MCVIGLTLIGKVGIAGRVEIRQNADASHTLLRDGVPYLAKGAGGSSALRELAAAGANSVRTWGVETLATTVDGKPFLDRCHELGLSVTAGIWIKHERHGFDYKAPAQIEAQRKHVRDAVRKYKDHPAILVWGLGNEMEGPTSDGSEAAVWKELNELAAIIKAEDPDHPVMTVIAGAHPNKIRMVREHYPNIDILGVNAYAGAGGVGKALLGNGWTKPFMLTEFGPVGHWEVGKTAWGAPVEPSSREKAASYYAAYQTLMDDASATCVGTHAFLWGNKQETTSTWYGMMLPTGEKLPCVDAMTRVWTGSWPANRSPKVIGVTTPLNQAVVKPGTRTTASAEVIDPEGDPLTYEWLVVSESQDTKEGGDAESVPPTHPECIPGAPGPAVEIRVPQKPGAYRLFLFVRDGKGGASAENFPFRVAN